MCHFNAVQQSNAHFQLRDQTGRFVKCIADPRSQHLSCGDWTSCATAPTLILPWISAASPRLLPPNLALAERFFKATRDMVRCLAGVFQLQPRRFGEEMPRSAGKELHYLGLLYASGGRYEMESAKKVLEPTIRTRRKHRSC